MESSYLKELYLMNSTGYFTGLKKTCYFDVLKDNYLTASENVKKEMDENYHLYLGKYKEGVIQINHILKYIKIIKDIMIFIVILIVIAIVFYTILPLVL